MTSRSNLKGSLERGKSLGYAGVGGHGNGSWDGSSKGTGFSFEMGSLEPLLPPEDAGIAMHTDSDMIGTFSSTLSAKIFALSGTW